MVRLLSLFVLSSILNKIQAQDSVFFNGQPVIFAPNRISGGAFEFNASFTTDNSTIFFSKASTNWDIMAIFSSSLKNDQWQQPVLLPFSGKYRDADPFVSFDGRKLYFISDRPVNGADYKNFDYHIFYVELNGSKVISEPIVVNLPLPVGMTPVYPSVAANGNLYFAAPKNGGNDIYLCEWKENKYLQPRLLPFNSDSTSDLDPVVAYDESFIIFTGNGRKGFGGNDLYISFQKDGVWTNPLNLGPQVNGRGSDMAPGLSRDNKKLYFTSYKEKWDRSLVDQKKLDFNKINDLLSSYQNGIGNIYEIDITSLVESRK
jgi:Tol biopolymer transport system component